MSSRNKNKSELKLQKFSLCEIKKNKIVKEKVLQKTDQNYEIRHILYLRRNMNNLRAINKQILSRKKVSWTKKESMNQEISFMNPEKEWKKKEKLLK